MVFCGRNSASKKEKTIFYQKETLLLLKKHVSYDIINQRLSEVIA